MGRTLGQNKCKGDLGTTKGMKETRRVGDSRRGQQEGTRISHKKDWKRNGVFGEEIGRKKSSTSLEREKGRLSKKKPHPPTKPPTQNPKKPTYDNVEPPLG